MANAKVDWFGEDVLLLINEATDEGLFAAALQIVAHTVANVVGNDQVDTGAMVNSAYAIGKAEDTFGQKPAGAPANNGKTFTAPKPELGSAPALAGVAVDYALWPELKNSFFLKAVEQVKGEVTEAEIQKVARKRGLI